MDGRMMRLRLSGRADGEVRSRSDGEADLASRVCVRGGGGGMQAGTTGWAGWKEGRMGEEGGEKKRTEGRARSRKTRTTGIRKEGGSERNEGMDVQQNGRMWMQGGQTGGWMD